MKKILFFIFFLTIFNSNAEQKLTLVASVNNSIITNLDISNEVSLIKIMNSNIKLGDNDLKRAALENAIDEILKNLEIKENNFSGVNQGLIDRQYNGLIKKLSENNETIASDIKNKIYKKIELDYKWNSLIKQKYSWKININMSEINEKLQYRKNENEEIKDFLASKENLLVSEKNKKLSIYSAIHLDKIKKKALIKFF
tara:strand:- start:168 stop:764 length:597 start_codon:yes stop_codon:yes gene_type:complete